MKIYSGALEIVGGLSEEQLNSKTAEKVNNSLQNGADYNGVKITTSGLTAESTQSKVSMDRTKGFEIIRKSDGKKMFAVEPATGNVVFSGDLSGASGNFTGSISSVKSSKEYTIISGGELESRGKFTRTWRGKTFNHDVSLQFKDGYFAAKSLNDDRSLYYSNFGISTYASGDQTESSGTCLLYTSPSPRD